MIKWQHHRLDVAEREVQLEALRAQLQAVQSGLWAEHIVGTIKRQPAPDKTGVLEGLEPLPAGLANLMAAREAQTKAEAQTEPDAEPDELPGAGHLATAVQAIENLGKVQAAEFVRPDDPRAGLPDR